VSKNKRLVLGFISPTTPLKRQPQLTYYTSE